MGAVVNPVYEETKLAASPPKRSKAAAVSVPVPRCGPGKDSGVKAYMKAYSIAWQVSTFSSLTSLVRAVKPTKVCQHSSDTSESQTGRGRVHAGICKEKDAGHNGRYPHHPTPAKPSVHQECCREWPHDAHSRFNAILPACERQGGISGEIGG